MITEQQVRDAIRAAWHADLITLGAAEFILNELKVTL